MIYSWESHVFLLVAFVVKTRVIFLVFFFAPIKSSKFEISFLRTVVSNEYLENPFDGGAIVLK